MASVAQITANRLNAQRSSQNALKSGCCSTRLVIAPESILKLEFFHRLLVHGWNLRRIRDDETALTEAERDEPNSRKLLLLGHYRHSLERSYERAMKALRELQTDRMQRSRCKPEPGDPFLTEFPLASPFILPDPVDVAAAGRAAEILSEPLPHLPPLPAPWERTSVPKKTGQAVPQAASVACAS